MMYFLILAITIRNANLHLSGKPFHMVERLRYADDYHFVDQILHAGATAKP